MGLEPAIPFEHRADAQASDMDARQALNNIDEVCVWEFFDIEFLRSDKHGVIARVDGLGTGAPTIAWALKYHNPFSLMRDWEEIKSVPGAIREAKKK